MMDCAKCNNTGRLSPTEACTCIRGNRESFRIGAEQRLAAATEALLAIASDDAFVEAIGAIASRRCIHCGSWRVPCHCTNDD